MIVNLFYIMAKFGENIFTGLMGSAASSLYSKLLALFLSLVLFRQMSLHQYGSYQLAVSVWGITSILLFQGLASFVLARASRFRANEQSEMVDELLRGFFLFLLLSACATFIVAKIYLSLAVSIRGDGLISNSVSLLAVSSFAYPFGILNRTLLLLHHRFTQVNAITVLEESVKVLVICALFVLGYKEAQSVILGIVVGSYVATITGMFLARKGLAPIIRGMSFSALNNIFRIIREEGVWSVLQKQVRQFGQSLRVFLVETMLGREAVALFGFAEKILSQILGLFRLEDSLVPMLAGEKERARVKLVFHLGVKYLFIVYTVAAIIALVATPIAVPQLFPKYISAIRLTQILLLFLPIAGVASLLSSFFISHHSQKRQFTLVSLRWLWFMPFAWILVRWIGLGGIAVEYVVSLYLFSFLRYRSLIAAIPWLRIEFSKMCSIAKEDRRLFVGLRDLYLRKLNALANPKR